MRLAADQLDQFLEADKEGQKWHERLGQRQLRAQLARGDRADPTALLEVLSRFGSGEPQLEQAPFVKLRRALVDWLAALPPPPPEQLPEAVRAAKSAFLPPTQTDLQSAKAELLAALRRLDARLKADGPDARKWREFLRPEQITHQLAQPKGPDLTALDAAYFRFAAGHEGLGLAWFGDVRRSLRDYVTLARLIGRPELRSQYEKVLEGLADNLEQYRQNPSDQTATAINLALEWLQRAGQAKWVVRATRHRFSHPNLLVEVSDRLVAARLAGPIEDSSPVRDCILGTDIHGTGYTSGQLAVDLVPSATAGQLDLVFRGQIDTDTIGYNGPVRIFSHATTHMEARKRLALSGEEVSGSPTVSQAQTASTIHAIRSRRGCGLVERIAWNRAFKQKAQADYIAARHAEALFSQRMDAEAAGLLARANDALLSKFRRPLADRRLWPEVFRFRTSEQALHLIVLEAADGSLAAPGAPPELDERADLIVKLHQSAINNFAAAALGGMIVDEKRAEQWATEYLGPLEWRKAPGEEQQHWTITFAPRWPIRVSFGEGTFSVTVSGQEYAVDGESYPGMNVTAVYRIQKTPRGPRALRQGRLAVFPPGFDPASGEQFPPRVQVLRTMLERRFGKLFQEDWTPKNLVLAPEGRQPVELQLTRWETTRGWLLLAWKRASK
ncbi:MAG: hypothetical protein ACUVUC_15550 [Thermoguttaceae bacterium]